MADDQDTVADQEADAQAGFDDAVKSAHTGKPAAAQAPVKDKAEEDTDKERGTDGKFKAKDEPAKVEQPVKDEKPKADKPAVKAEDKPKQQTAEERLAARASASEAGAKAEPKIEPPVVDKKVEPPPAAAVKADEKKVDALVDTAADLGLTDAELAGVKVNINGDEMTVAEAREMLPELVGVSLAVSKAIAAKLAAKFAAGKDADPKASGDLLRRMEAIQVERENARYFDAVTNGFVNEKGEDVAGHTDARKIGRSKDFAEWVGKQSPGVKAMMNSLDPLDGIALLDAYKESRMRAAAGKPTKVDADREARRRALVESAAGEGGSAHKPLRGDDDDNPDDKNAGFDDAVTKKS